MNGYAPPDLLKGRKIEVAEKVSRQPEKLRSGAGGVAEKEAL